MEEHIGDVVPRNLATWDRAWRIALGLALFSAGFLGLVNETTGGILRLVSILPLTLGAFGWSPLYQVLGISSKKVSLAAPTLDAHSGVLRATGR